MKRKVTKKQLSMIKKQRLFEQRIAKTRIKQFIKCYDVLSQEIETTLLKSDIESLRDKIDKIVDSKFTKQLKLSLNTVAELNINEFIEYFMRVFKRNINLDDLQAIKSKALKRFMNKYTAESITHITRTTKDILKTRITRYTEQGLSFRDIVKNIVADTKGSIGKARATVIARVETSKAMAITNYDSADKAGLKYKTWIYTFGSVTKRKYHEVMNGVTIPINKKFDVGGEGKVPPVKMRFPKDPECNVAGQIISCSCTVFYT